jgi:hypothetical protein
VPRRLDNAGFDITREFSDELKEFKAVFMDLMLDLFVFEFRFFEYFKALLDHRVQLNEFS